MSKYATACQSVIIQLQQYRHLIRSCKYPTYLLSAFIQTYKDMACDVRRISQSVTLWTSKLQLMC